MFTGFCCASLKYWQLARKTPVSDDLSPRVIKTSKINEAYFLAPELDRSELFSMLQCIFLKMLYPKLTEISRNLVKEEESPGAILGQSALCTGSVLICIKVSFSFLSYCFLQNSSGEVKWSQVVKAALWQSHLERVSLCTAGHDVCPCPCIHPG